jgi:hypothetical protein
MSSVFRDYDVGDKSFRRQTTLDEPRRCRRLHDAIGARPAGVSRSTGDDDAKSGRNAVEALRDILGNDVQIAAAAPAHLALRFDDLLFAGEMLRQVTPIGIAPLDPFPPRNGARRICRGIGVSVIGLDILQREFDLLVADTLGAAPELRAAQYRDDVIEALVLCREPRDFRRQSVRFGGHRLRCALQSLTLGFDAGSVFARRQDHRLESGDVIREIVRDLRHGVRIADLAAG